MGDESCLGNGDRTVLVKHDFGLYRCFHVDVFFCLHHKNKRAQRVFFTGNRKHGNCFQKATQVLFCVELAGKLRILSNSPRPGMSVNEQKGIFPQSTLSK
jgi:hypothetical protein